MTKPSRPAKAAKAAKPIHVTELPTQALANLFRALSIRGITSGEIAQGLGITVQKVGAIKRHVKK